MTRISGTFRKMVPVGTFCPVMRLHGDREPRQPQYGTTGGRHAVQVHPMRFGVTGKVYEICVKYLNIRNSCGITRKLMKSPRKGTGHENHVL